MVAKLHGGRSPSACSTGFEFTDYPSRGVEDGVKVGTKAWDIFEACLNRRLTPDEELDTDDLIGKKFEAMVVVKIAHH